MRTRTATNRCLPRVCRTCVGVLAGLLFTSACNRDSNTGSLHDDVNLGRIKEVEARLDTGEPVDSKDDEGLTALHLAFLSKDRKIIELLLARGADITMTDPLGNSVLHLIAGDTPAYCTLLALDRGIPVDARTNDGTSALHRASYSGNRAVAELLVRRGALVDARDDAGRTPLHFAAAQREILALLLSKGADINAAARSGSTVLHYAARWTRPDISEQTVDIIALLLAHGVDVNVQDEKGVTPLMGAVTIHAIEVFNFLLSRGAKIDTIDAVGDTIFHHVIQCRSLTADGKVDMLRLLLKAGAAPNVANALGRTPLHAAAELGNWEVIQPLIHGGVAKTAKDKDGLTAADVAAKAGYGKIAGALRKP